MNEDLDDYIEAVQRILQPLKESEFSEKLGKVSTYMGSIGKSFAVLNSNLESIGQQLGGDQESYRKAVQDKIAANKLFVDSFLKFARMNLDLVRDQALDKLVKRPKSADKVDEQKMMDSLSRWFDQLPDPAPAMIEHFKASSSPLDKYLVIGKWGHEYLQKRHVNPEVYDSQLCVLISCKDTAAAIMVQSYGKLGRAIDDVEKVAKETREALENESGKEP